MLTRISFSFFEGGMGRAELLNNYGLKISK